MNLDPSTMSTLLSGSNDPEQQSINQQQQLVNALRAKGMSSAAPGHMAGQVYVPNYGQIVGNLAAAAMAGKQQQNLDQRTTALHDKQMNARTQYLDALMMSLRRQYPAQPGMLPPDGMEDR